MHLHFFDKILQCPLFRNIKKIKETQILNPSSQDLLDAPWTV